MFLPVLCIVLTVVQKCMCTGQAMERGLPSMQKIVFGDSTEKRSAGGV